jgi:hypothetical protein
MKGIGLDRRTRVLAGWHRITTENGSSRDTGMEITDGLNTITIRTTIGTGIFVTTTATGITSVVRPD